MDLKQSDINPANDPASNDKINSGNTDEKNDQEKNLSSLEKSEDPPKEAGQAEIITDSIAGKLINNTQSEDQEQKNIENASENKESANIDSTDESSLKENVQNQNENDENLIKDENKESASKEEKEDINIIENKEPELNEGGNNSNAEANKEESNNLNGEENKEESNNSNTEENKEEEEEANNSNAEENKEDNEDVNSIIQFSPAFSEEDILYSFNQMYNNGKIPENSMFPQLLQMIYREKTEAIDNQDYDRAKKLESMISAINNENDSYAYSYPGSGSRYLEERDARLRQQLATAKTKYKAKLDHHTESWKSRLTQLQVKQQQEVDDLKSKYQDPSFLNRFNRPSQKLLSMRKMERNLALAKKYQEARQIKKLADDQQRIEEIEMQVTAQQSMQVEYVKMIERQKRDLERLEQFDMKMQKEIKMAKQKEISPIRRALKQTAVRKANENKKPSFYSSSALSRSSSALQRTSGAKNYNPEMAREVMSKTQNVLTPRTLKKLNMLRINNKVELNVDPIDDSTFDKLEQLNAKRVKSLLPKL